MYQVYWSFECCLAPFLFRWFGGSVWSEWWWWTCGHIGNKSILLLAPSASGNFFVPHLIPLQIRTGKMRRVLAGANNIFIVCGERICFREETIYRSMVITITMMSDYIIILSGVTFFFPSTCEKKGREKNENFLCLVTLLPPMWPPRWCA